MLMDRVVACRVSAVLVIGAVIIVLFAIPVAKWKDTNQMNEQLWIKINEVYELSLLKEKRIRVQDDKILELREASLNQKFMIEQLQNELREWKNYPEKSKLLKWTKELIHSEYGPTLWKQMEKLDLHCIEASKSPLPNITSLLQDPNPQLPSLVTNLEDYQIYLSQQLSFYNSCAEYSAEYDELMSLTQRSSIRFSYVDGLLYYCLLRTHQPKRVVQIGSDILMDYIAASVVNQTADSKLMWITWQTWSPFNNPKFVVIPQLLVDIPKQTFFELDSGDMIIHLNSSHILHRSSDVHYFYLQILPKLNPGVFIYLSDIYFPYDNYPIEIVTQHLQFPAEDYLLQSFLLHNSHYNVLWSGNYITPFINSTMQSKTFILNRQIST